MVQQLKKIKVDRGDVLYYDGEYAEEIFFIKQGKVKLFATNDFPFMTLKNGETFGDFEVIFNEHRMGKAVA